MRFFKLKVLASLAIVLLVGTLSVSFAQDEAIAEAEIAVAEAVAEPEETPAAATSAIRPLTVAAGLVDDTMLTGTLMDSTSLSIKTAFGEASIPLGEVAGIRFPIGEDTSTTVVMLNGDSITGATEMKFVSVETTWGSAKINGQSIATMLFVPGLKWTSMEALGGKRWTLVESTTSSTAQPSRVQPASGTSSVGTSSVVQPSTPLPPQNQNINRFPFRP
ncbi:MAG: hypothetical protein AAF483_25560 [Planctomycetota bacterium]